MRRRRQSESARTRRTAPAAPNDLDSRIPERRQDSEWRPQTFGEWLVWLALWPIVMAGWLVAVPFALIYIVVGSIMGALFGIRLRRSEDSDGAGSAG